MAFRWTAPTTHDISINGSFDQFSGNTAITDVHVYLGTVSQFDAVIDGTTTTAPFSINLSNVTAGTTVSFIVGKNVDDSNSNSHLVSFNGTVAVPEPTSVLAIGAVGALGIRYRRRLLGRE